MVTPIANLALPRRVQSALAQVRPAAFSNVSIRTVFQKIEDAQSIPRNSTEARNHRIIASNWISEAVTDGFMRNVITGARATVIVEKEHLVGINCSAGFCMGEDRVSVVRYLGRSPKIDPGALAQLSPEKRKQLENVFRKAAPAIKAKLKKETQEVMPIPGIEPGVPGLPAPAAVPWGLILGVGAAIVGVVVLATMGGRRR